MTEHTKRLMQLFHDAARLIDERGYQLGTVQIRGDANAGLTVVGALKLGLLHRPNATMDQMGADAPMFASAVHYINIFMGHRSFRDWCEDPGNTKTAAKLLLKTMAAELERRAQHVSQ